VGWRTVTLLKPWPSWTSACWIDSIGVCGTADEAVSHVDFRRVAMMDLVRPIHEPIHRTGICGAGPRRAVGYLDIEQRRTLLNPAAGKSLSSRSAFGGIAGVEVRIPVLRQHVEATDRLSSGGRDARIGVGEKCEAGTKPSGVRAVVESLNFRGVGRNEVIVEA